MKIRCIIFFSFLFLNINSSLFSQVKPVHKEYKKIDTISLKAHIYSPVKIQKRSLPAIIFYHGGGWAKGDYKQFEPHCQYLAKRGMIAISVDYRLINKHGVTTPLECMYDAKSAYRWVVNNADALHIDTSKILVGGGSAGGHLAASVALIDKFNQPDENSFPIHPKGMVLFNPVVDVSYLNRFNNLDTAALASPINYIDATAPPAIIFHGTDDTVVLPSDIIKFQKKMQRAKAHCEVILFGGESHAFFNYNRPQNYKRTLVLMDIFLSDLGVIPQLKPINCCD